MNINFGLLPPMEVPRKIAKADKQRMYCERALAALDAMGVKGNHA
jgi:folate-dependent tRNA-U54 methylase TrmFO/GidA